MKNPSEVATIDVGPARTLDRRTMGSDKWGIGHTVSGLMPNGEKFSG
jgi:hypothetical protein